MSHKFSVVALALAVGLVACTDQPLTSPDALSVSPNFDANPVIERVNAAGNDICEALGAGPGCDGNFSLHALLRADGSVTGQWQDAFAGGGEGIHAVIDCMNIVGNGAVLSGWITNGQIGGVDVTGQSVLTAVVDNGTSANDPADQISFSFSNFPLTCNDLIPDDFPLFDMTRGQVTVR